ncbi:hypothetical protein [Sphingomonas sp. Leaf242]|uniref:hypothetical protein n=1 Tax=Sphingomonas sp. Leaf242 TaxID=1736304 RepID=UPI000712F933|nr:hypothetical protein [Sphingomonas sp. Leaf242]KQO12759.1 hypothetical protein ASF09_00050 [Sphingomonas sp. Leaf242]
MKLGNLMRFAYLAVPVAVCLPSLAHATSCEEAFTKTGNIIGGQRFGAAVTVTDLTPESAIGQLRGIVASRGYVVMSAEPEAGSMLFEQSVSGKARGFPLTVSTTANGGAATVSIQAKLPRGMTANAVSAKSEMCQILGALKGGRAGTAAAASRVAAVGKSTPIAMTAFSFSHQISKDTQRNPAATELRYRDQTFVFSGNVGSLDKWGNSYAVMFDIPEPSREALRLPNQAPFKTDIVCKMAAGQATYYLQLKPGKSITLSGAYESLNFDRHVLVLKDCRSVK